MHPEHSAPATHAKPTSERAGLSLASHETRDSRKILREPYYLFRVFGGASVTAVEIAGFRSAYNAVEAGERPGPIRARARARICTSVCVTSLFSNSTKPSRARVRPSVITAPRV